MSALPRREKVPLLPLVAVDSTPAGESVGSPHPLAKSRSTTDVGALGPTPPADRAPRGPLGRSNFRLHPESRAHEAGSGWLILHSRPTRHRARLGADPAQSQWRAAHLRHCAPRSVVQKKYDLGGRARVPPANGRSRVPGPSCPRHSRQSPRPCVRPASGAAIAASPRCVPGSGAADHGSRGGWGAVDRANGWPPRLAMAAPRPRHDCPLRATA